MRTRDRDEDWIEELGRRRLEALIAELSPPSGSRPGADVPAWSSSEDDRRAERGADPGDDEVEDAPGRHARRALSPGGRVRGWVVDRVPEAVRSRGLQQG